MRYFMIIVDIVFNCDMPWTEIFGNVTKITLTNVLKGNGQKMDTNDDINA